MKAHAFGSLPPVSTITLGGGGLGMLWGVLCNIPLDLPVDELVTWRELADDSRLAPRARRVAGMRFPWAPTP
jgi:hypothetical protein